MHLPELVLNGDTQTIRGDLVRLVSEWIFSSSFKLGTSNLTSNTASPQTPNSTNTNVFCLVSRTESVSDTLPMPCIVHWLNEIGYLGGYISFTPSPNYPARTPQSTLHALPITLTHQACSVEADASKNFIDAFAKNPWAVNEDMEQRFEALFVTPLRAFVFSRPGYTWKPLDPMVFVLDCSHLVDPSSTMESPLGLNSPEKERLDIEDARKLEKEGRLAYARLADWVTSREVRTLPAHVKFLILAHRRTGLGSLLENKGVPFVYEA